MRKPWPLGLILIATSIASAQEHPLPPKPEKEHQWLQQFVGEWTTDAEVIMEPGKPPTKCEGTESVRTVGGMWTISEIKSTPAGQPMVGIMTLGDIADKDPNDETEVGASLGDISSPSQPDRSGQAQAGRPAGGSHQGKPRRQRR